MRIRTTTAALALAAAVVLGAAGCSSGSSSDDAAPAAATATSTTVAAAAQDDGKAALAAAVADYTAKLFDGDSAGYNYLSKRCKQQLTHDAWDQLATDGHQQYGSQKATGIHVDQLSGDLARVSYGAGKIPQFDRTGQPWVREDGTWRWDAC